MRIASCLTLVLISPLVWAQGDGVPAEPTLAEKVKASGTVGAGYIQADFFAEFRRALTDEFRAKRAGEMMDALQSAKLTPVDVTRLMNGKATRSDFQKWLKATRPELPGCERALKKAVAAKNRKLLFGMVAVTMVGEFDVAPEGEFSKQVCAARDSMPQDDFETLLKGSRSRGTMQACFGLKGKDDQDLMKEILKRVADGPYADHPLAESLGLGKPSDFDPSKCPPLTEGMPGFGESDDGTAGGLPLDPKLPPCPFAGDNMKDLFEQVPGG